VLFFGSVLGIWISMHVYVFWRLASIPWIETHLSRFSLVTAAAILGTSYLLARVLYSIGWDGIAKPLEYVGGNWIGILFLLLTALLFIDCITLGGHLLPHRAPEFRFWAVLAALTLSGVALVQGIRPPKVQDYTVEIRGLPRERDGLILAAISDTHLGTMIGPRWMEKVADRIIDMQPDMVVLLGDILEDRNRKELFLPAFRSIRAPLGVWAVTGNHEYYTGLDRNISLWEEMGYTVLRDRWVEVFPGLVLAGVDDLTARREYGKTDRIVEKTLENRPAGATILCSHTPWQADQAAAAGVDLMLSGHTHNGQIWPFNYITKFTYPLTAGRYEVDGMTVIVCRGTGTWGSRMRLWSPGEILRIRLTAKAEGAEE
jgi:predicted MPP superfamily phosphohydrolase